MCVCVCACECREESKKENMYPLLFFQTTVALGMKSAWE